MFDKERTAAFIEADGQRARELFERLNDLEPLVRGDQQDIVRKLASDAFMLSKSLKDRAKELREKGTL
jgi:hypothetical protein